MTRQDSSYQHPERPTLDTRDIEGLARSVPPRYRATVYVLAWGAIRLGEAVELRRKDADLERLEIRVERAVYPLDGNWGAGTFACTTCATPDSSWPPPTGRHSRTSNSGTVAFSRRNTNVDE